MESNQMAAEARARISIEYYGEAKDEAEQFRSALAQSHAHITDVRRRDPDDVDMAVTEIIITIVVTAAAKAVASTALEYLEIYIRKQIEEGKKPPDVQVVIKREEDGKTVDRIPVSFGTMGLEMLAAFSKNLRGAIDKI